MAVRTRLCLNPAEMQVLAALRAHRSNIVLAERRFRVDRRAIAGAIAWEMLENVRPWSWTRSLGRSVGYAKVHTYNVSITPFDTIASQTEDRGYLPARTFTQRRQLLATPEGAITYVGGILAAIAETTVACGFGDIRSDPVMLVHVFQQHTLDSWAEHLRNRARSSLVAGNPMALWVRRHFDFLEEAVGEPDLPESSSD